jgi:Family of unknown function (DUF6011)
MHATEKQVDYIRALTDSKDLTTLDETQKSWVANPENHENLTKDQASRVIQALKDLPWRTRTMNQLPTDKQFENVPEGYFFIVDPIDGVEKFFKVDKPDKGKWSGYTFLKVQAGSDFWPIKNKEHRGAVLAEIAIDPVAAMNEYGLRLGRCGVCNRILTARDSRLRGIGPICAARL